MDLAVGSVVISRAGRDKGVFYAVYALEGSEALVCDGKLRPVSRPKRKNLKHLAATHYSVELADSDKQLRKLLKQYNRN